MLVHSKTHQNSNSNNSKTNLKGLQKCLLLHEHNWSFSISNSCLAVYCCSLPVLDFPAQLMPWVFNSQISSFVIECDNDREISNNGSVNWVIVMYIPVAENNGSVGKTTAHYTYFKCLRKYSDGFRSVGVLL